MAIAFRTTLLYAACAGMAQYVRRSPDFTCVARARTPEGEVTGGLGAMPPISASRLERGRLQESAA